MTVLYKLFFGGRLFRISEFALVELYVSGFLGTHPFATLT